MAQKKFNEDNKDKVQTGSKRGGSKPNGRSSGKRRNARSKSNESFGKADNVTSKVQPSWYTTNAPLADAAARLPFVWPLGNPITIQGDGTGGSKLWHYKDTKMYIPGVCALRIAPTIGYVTSAQDPINVAATTEYAFVRHVNSGSRNYDAVDLMKYNVAVANVYALLGFLMRAYGIARTYSGANRYLPETILHAMGISDPHVMLKSLVTVEYQINMLIQKISTLAVPNNMTYFSRLAALFQNVYAESESALAQFYLYVPDGFYYWSDTEIGLKYEPTPIDLSLTWDKWILKANNYVDKIFRSEDCGIISGDILHAYGDNIIKLAPMPTDYTTPILHDTVVLNQMKNASPVELKGGTNDITVTMSDKTAPILECHPEALEGMQFGLSVLAPIMLQYNEGDDTSNFLYEATRLRTTRCPGEAGYAQQIFAGTEICTGVYIWEKPFKDYNDSYLSPLHAPKFIHLGLTDTGSFKLEVPAMQYMLAKRAFNYAPTLAIYKDSGIEGEALDFVGFDVNIDNFQILSCEELRRLHETANISLFNVPLIGRV